MSEQLERRTERLNQEEIDTLVSHLIETGTSDVAVYSAVRKLDDIVSGAGNVPDELSRVCQKCKEEIDEDEEWFVRFGHFYCGAGPEPGCLE